MIEDPDRWAPGVRRGRCVERDLPRRGLRGAGPAGARAARQAGARAGMALKPATPVEPYADLLAELDMMLVMTVEPGFGGQTFLDVCLPKIRRARELIAAARWRLWLQVDGGVSAETIERCAEAGADVFVAGSAVFGADDPDAMVARLARSGCPRRWTSLRARETWRLGAQNLASGGFRRAQPPAGLFGVVVGVAADDVRRGDAGVHQVRDQSLRRVRQVVAVVHPDAGVVGDERDLVGLAVARRRASRPTTGCRWPARRRVRARPRGVRAGASGGLSPLWFSIVITTTSPSLDHEHRHVGEQVAVDRPPEAGLAVEEAGRLPIAVVEVPVRVGRVEAERRRARRTSAGRRHARGSWRRRAVRGLRADHHARCRRRSRPAPPSPGACTPRSARPPAGTTHGLAGHLGGLVEVACRRRRARRTTRRSPRCAAGRRRC